MTRGGWVVLTMLLLVIDLALAVTIVTLLVVTAPKETTVPVPEIVNPFAVYAGDAWEQPLRFTVEDAENPQAPREPEDLTGWTGWECQWRPFVDSDTVLDLTVTVTDPTDGIVTITATGEQTRDMAVGGGFDVQAVKAGTPRTFVRGSTEWWLDYTRA